MYVCLDRRNGGRQNGSEHAYIARQLPLRVYGDQAVRVLHFPPTTCLSTTLYENALCLGTPDLQTRLTANHCKRSKQPPQFRLTIVRCVFAVPFSIFPNLRSPVPNPLRRLTLRQSQGCEKMPQMRPAHRRQLRRSLRSLVQPFYTVHR